MTDLLRHFALVAAVAYLWLWARPTLDLRKVWARTVVPLTPDDIEEYRREEAERRDRWDRELLWLSRRPANDAYWRVGS